MQIFERVRQLELLFKGLCLHHFLLLLLNKIQQLRFIPFWNVLISHIFMLFIDSLNFREVRGQLLFQILIVLLDLVGEDRRRRHEDHIHRCLLLDVF